MRTNWTNKKIKYWINEKIYVDIETGEIVTEEEFKKDYIKIKTEVTKKYKNEYGYTTTTRVGTKNGKQIGLFTE